MAETTTTKKHPSAELGDTYILVFRESRMALFFPLLFPLPFFLGSSWDFFFISTSYNTRHQTLAHLDTLSSLSPLGWFYLPTINRRNILCICSRQNYISFPWMPQLANCIKEGEVIWEKNKCMRYYAKVACWRSTGKWMLRGKQESFLSGFLL